MEAFPKMAAEREGGVGSDAALDAIVGSSVAMQRLRRELQAAADSPSTVLLSGETGTGKGLAARALHDASSRARAPFVHVDCASLAPALIESELFGHERGAFTGASALRRGRFESAGAGTVFLDEIAELPAVLQAKLLRVLQDRRFERVGGGRTLVLRARVVAATNRDLHGEVRRGRFRADLLYRLKVVHVRIPPLRRRKSDLAALASAAITKRIESFAARAPVVTPGFLAALTEHDWPGNVRELENAIERLLVRGDAVWGRAQAEACVDALHLDQMEFAFEEPGERERLLSALAEARGNVARAARALALPRSTLRYRIAKLGITRSDAARSRS